ncbi:MAG: hypothetical protein NVSMB9_16860 [Isosphaeraceae bacterium]
MVCVFARGTSEPLASLVKSLDSEIAKNPSLKSFVVMLTDDADKTSDTLKKLAQECGVKNIPLTLVESPAGPPSYKIARDADITVMMWKGTAVKVNHAYKKGGLVEADVKTILSDLPKILKDDQ